jgi:hypothetical protein
MSALDASAVVALTNKAMTLLEQGAYARAAEKFALAEADAQALGVPNCLVVAALQLWQATCWLLQGNSPLLAAAEAERMRHTARTRLLPALHWPRWRAAGRPARYWPARAHRTRRHGSARFRSTPRG